MKNIDEKLKKAAAAFREAERFAQSLDTAIKSISDRISEGTKELSTLREKVTNKEAEITQQAIAIGAKLTERGEKLHAKFTQDRKVIDDALSEVSKRERKSGFDKEFNARVELDRQLRKIGDALDAKIHDLVRANKDVVEAVESSFRSKRDVLEANLKRIAADWRNDPLGRKLAALLHGFSGMLALLLCVKNFARWMQFRGLCWNQRFLGT